MRDEEETAGEERPKEMHRPQAVPDSSGEQRRPNKERQGVRIRKVWYAQWNTVQP